MKDLLNHIFQTIKEKGFKLTPRINFLMLGKYMTL
jgi:hypothetical protein